MIHPRFYFSAFRPCAPFFYTRQPSPALQHPFHHHSRIASVVHFLACAHKTILGPECLALAVSFGKAQPGTPQTLPFQKAEALFDDRRSRPFSLAGGIHMKRPMNAVSSLGYLRIRSITAVSILPSKKSNVKFIFSAFPRRQNFHILPDAFQRYTRRTIFVKYGISRRKAVHCADIAVTQPSGAIPRR